MITPSPDARAAKASAILARRSLRRYQLAGYAAIITFFGAFGGWAATSMISGAVIAPALVVVESSIKKVQHTETATVAEIRVKNGDKVTAGTPLIRLEDTDIRANLQITDSQIAELYGRQMRLTAERDRKSRLGQSNFPRTSIEAPRLEEIWEGQANLLVSRLAMRNGRQAQSNERVAQLEEQIKSLDLQVASRTELVRLARSELDMQMQLRERELGQLPRLISAQKEVSRLDAERGSLLTDIAKTKVQISETRQKSIEDENSFLSDVLTELREVDGKIAEAQEKRVALESKLKRTLLLAPQAGVVHKLNVFTIGGVIQAGEIMMEIVPQLDELVIEAKVDPNDIDRVAVDQPAVVRIPAFHLNTTPEMIGKVILIAPDARQDSQQTAPYYQMRVALTASELTKLGDKKLIPGLPVEVYVQTGERTVLDYLVRPLTDYLWKVGKER